MNSFDSLEEVRNTLIPMGFREYKPTPFDNDGICACFQKRIDDENGKMFFIDAKIWDYSWTNKVKENYHIAYETQLYKKGTHDAVSLDFIDWTEEQVEDFVKKMFHAKLIEHYEEWEKS